MKSTVRRVTAFVLLITFLLAFFIGCGNNDKADKDSTEKSTEPSGTTITVATVTSRELNLRSTPSYEGTILKTLKKGDTVTILERTEVNGVSWGKTEKGWICLLYVTLEEITTEKEQIETTTTAPAIEAPAKNNGLIIVESLNIRSGPDAKEEKIGEYTWEETIEILEEQNGWGRTDKGWISLSYVYRADKPDMTPIQVTVIASTLNIRQGPSVNYASLDKLSQDEETTILKQITMNGTYWGYNGTGWLNMDYVEPTK